MGAREYFGIVLKILDKVCESQQEKIAAAARMLVDTVQAGGSVYVFGCTHAGILAEEMFYRTGGLAVVNPLLPPGLTCGVRPITLTGRLERMEGYGSELARTYLKKNDMILIHSVSGRNAVPIDMALESRRIGASVAAITNVEHSRASKSRHSSGQRLMEIVDLVIDNCGCYGDAALAMQGFPQKMGPTSTVAGAAIVNAIAVEAAAEFLRRGVEPPVLLSANIDGGDEYNVAIFKKYASQIHYLEE